MVSTSVGLQFSATSLTKRIVLVVLNVLIMLMAMSSTILSLYQVKLMPETYGHVVTLFQSKSSTALSSIIEQTGAEDRALLATPQDPTRLNQEQQRQLLELLLKQLSWYDDTSATSVITIATTTASVVTKVEPSTRRSAPNFDVNIAPIQALLDQAGNQKRWKRAESAGKPPLLPDYFEEIFFFTQKSLYVSMAAGLVAFLSSLVGICGGIFRVPRCLKLSVGGVLLVMLMEMATAGFIFVAHDKMLNRNSHRHFEQTMDDLCHAASVCVNPMMLVMVGSFLIASVLLQVGSVTLSCKMIGEYADRYRPERRMEKLMRRQSTLSLIPSVMNMYPAGQYPSGMMPYPAMMPMSTYPHSAHGFTVPMTSRPNINIIS